MADWQSALDSLKTALALSGQAKADLERWETETAAVFETYARAESGLELDMDEIKKLVRKPYTLLPINEHEAWLIQARAVKMPMVGWLVAQDGAFNKFKVSRSMDLLTPLPAWMKKELGWKPPEHAAVIDGTRTTLRLTEGDEAAFKRKYGAHLGAKQVDGAYKIRGGDAWIKLVAQLIRDGILPYTPQPVAAEHWDATAKLNPDLLAVLEKLDWQHKRPFLQRAVDEFHAKGAVLVNYPPGAGKTLVACLILNRFRGRVLILADTTILVEQWRDRVKKFVGATGVDVTISAYQGAAKYLDQEWDLIIPDEAQRLPATTFSRLAFVKTKSRLGLTGSPWREDDRQFMITALAGFPVSIRWAELVTAGVLRRPRIIVATVASDAAKTSYVRQLLAKRKGGRALIFCDWIERGQQIADALDVPFVHGATPRKLERVLESEVCVVSRIGDRGLDLRDLKLVIEVAGAGAAREQFAQRVGRLLHGEFEGEFHTVFTPDEAERYRPRVFGVEAELAGEVDIEFVNVGVIAEPVERTARVRPAASRTGASRPLAIKPGDEVGALLALPAVRKLLDEANANIWPGRDYMGKLIRLCWDAPLSIEELRAGKGLAGRALSAYRAAKREGLRLRLLAALDNDRFMADKAAFKNFEKLSQRFK